MDAEKRLGQTVRMADSEGKQHYKQEFIERVRHARASTGKKQWEIALAMGVEQVEYKHWEQTGPKGRLIPTHLIARFCFACHVEPTWLLTGHGRMKGSPVPELIAEATPVAPKRVAATTKRRAAS